MLGDDLKEIKGPIDQIIIQKKIDLELYSRRYELGETILATCVGFSSLLLVSCLLFFAIYVVPYLSDFVDSLLR